MLVSALELILPLGVPLWAGVLVFMALLYTAVVDARTGLVPPLPLLLAALAVIVGLYVQQSPRLYTAPFYAVMFATVIYGANWLYYRLQKRDALGMGDAYWSALVVLAYGLPETLATWGVGAWLGLLWLGARRLLKKPAGQVYFVPFLFAALLLVMLFVRL